MNTAEEIVQKFVQKLLEEQGVAELGVDADVRTELEKDLTDRVHDRVNAAILSALPPDKTAEFETLLDSGPEEEIRKFCAAAIPNLDQMIAGELLAFRRTYLGVE